MFRLLLTIAMLVQVATCSMNCALAAAPQAANAEPTKHCSCCDAVPTTSPSVPCEQEDDDGCGVCFCNSATSPVGYYDLSLILDSHAIWTLVELQQPLQVAPCTTTFRTPWHPGDATGIGLRLAVQSLLL